MIAAVKKAIGFRFFDRDRRGVWHLRLRWAEISSGFGLALSVDNFGDDSGGHWSLHIHLPWPNIYLRLPIPRREPAEMLDSWGFSLFDSALHLKWGERTKIVHLPWSLDWVRTSYLMHDGRSWLHETSPRMKPPLGTPVERQHFFHRELPLWRAEYPYRYVLRSGEVQERTATVTVDEMEWRRRGWRWLRLGRLVRRTIDVNFSDEVGERSGSWKGGTVGCSYELRPDETPHECLLRMERDRKFT